ncbi:hypothetical protein PIB30_071596 [Stylosanthes scabra]|uniref:RNase H type-1 domain-containing protein n=1 Tax=Stylosanthes scabra TaxID=79078 RepID=A0ABU6RNR1_9FABA|nr:hypothetical protein [Stylosanthes scabra]
MLMHHSRRTQHGEQLQPFSETTMEELSQDVFKLQEEIPNCGFTWIPREGNEVADYITKLAASNNLPVNWILNPPPELQVMFRKELLGRPFR